MKKILNEIGGQKTNLYQEDEANRWEVITDPYLQTAARAGCYGDGYVPNVEHPDPNKRGMNTVQVIKREDGVIKYIYFTPRKSNLPDHTKTDIYTGETNNQKWVDTVNFKCKRLEDRTNPKNLSGVAKETYEFITRPIDQKGLGYKKYGDVSKDDFFNYKLVELLKDPDLKPDGKYGRITNNIQAMLDTMESQRMKLFLWKPVKGQAPVFDIQKQQTDVDKYFADEGYTKCPTESLEGGDYAKVDLHSIYPSTYEPNTFMCKPWSDLGTKKADCISSIDSYYEEIVKYTNSQGTTLTPKKQLALMKNQVNKCMAEWYNEKGFKGLRRRKKMEFIKSLKASSPFVLRESTDKLTNIIRESLRIVKIVKNS